MAARYSTPEANEPEINGEKLLTIGALAKACGVTVRTLRYYEEMDLIGPVKRSAGKYRLYNERSLKRIKAIVALQDLNYSLEQILAMMGAHSEASSYSKTQRLQATQESLQSQKEHVSSKLVSLQNIKQDIERRLTILKDVCEPCLKQKPKEACHDGCQYRDTHLN